MTEPREIHLHLTAQPGTTVHVTIAGEDITVVSNDAEPAADAPDTAPARSEDEVLEAAIQRLESSGTSPNIRKAVDGLLALGYTFKLAKASPGKQPENYLRIIDPKYTAHGVGYLTPGTFSFSRTSDRDRLKDMPGAWTVSNAVNFSHADSAQPGLDAARLLKA
jgi:hypothetical protein